MSALNTNSRLETIHHLIALRKLDNAKTLIQDLLSTEPENEYCFALLAWCEFLNGNVKQALDLSKISIGMNPKSTATPYLVLAHSYKANNRINKALKASKNGLNNFPNDHRFYSILSEIEINRNKKSKAKGYADKGLELDPQNITLLNLKAETLNSHRADEVLNMALSMNPLNPQTLTNKGWIALKNKKWDQALQFFNSALQYDPNDHKAQYGLEIAHVSSIKWSRAFLSYIIYLYGSESQLLIGCTVGLSLGISQLISNFEGNWNEIQVFSIICVTIFLLFALPYFMKALALQKLFRVNKNIKRLLNQHATSKWIQVYLYFVCLFAFLILQKVIKS